MTKKVLEFELKGGSYWTSDNKGLCGVITKRYFDVGKTFDLHFATKPPRHDEYYILIWSSGTVLHFFDGPDKGFTPWPIWLDGWICRHFSKGKVYMWAMG